MRVNESNLTEAGSSTASRASESQRIQVDSGSTSAQAGTAATDRVSLSGLTGRISQTLQALSSPSSQRAGQLQKAVRAGSYQPDARQLASVMASF
jgi:anti-sigma28 factor (negative regulator of flagellin synthesis)